MAASGHLARPTADERMLSLPVLDTAECAD